jgi:cobalt-zinc-cadmium efflux system outer membrane protein
MKNLPRSQLYQNVVCGATLVAFVFSACPPVGAQVQLADEVILLSKGARAQESVRTNTHLGTAPGAGGSRFAVVPRFGDPLLAKPTGDASMIRRDVLSAAAASPGAQPLPGPAETLITPPRRLAPAELPLYGALEMPTQGEEGPPDGLTLDAAIDRLVRENFDLRTRYREIPKAQADILSAGLRGNPLIFASADNVPYGSYSPQRPGENGYGIAIVQPVDVNHKRRVRILAAQRAKRVIEAQYQNALRLEIDNLYTAFVDVLATRETVRYLDASLSGLNEILQVADKQWRSKQISLIDVNRLTIQRDSAQIALEEANAALVKARTTLATLINIPSAAAEQLAVRGSIVTLINTLPPIDELVGLALANRPDLMSYRLGVQRARADASVARAEAFPDIFVLYTPFGYQNNTPTGGQDATSWGLGVFASVPLFNRNQGNIQWAAINVSQTSLETAGIERQIQTEVLQAVKNYSTALGTVAKLEHDVVPRARDVRNMTLNLFRSGEEGAVGYLNAQREYSEVIRQYRDALIRLRRAALNLNTVVALRITR